jgi:endogenous inhibitor of DNA gyrase (YacG/DUF329 family)
MQNINAAAEKVAEIPTFQYTRVPCDFCGKSIFAEHAVSFINQTMNIHLHFCSKRCKNAKLETMTQ